MCGIAGVYGIGQHLTDAQKKDICQSLEHRGPDESGIYADDLVTLFHSRLSIIGIEDGQQPMTNQEVTIVFNGEIYNYRVLKEKLQSKGYKFSTSSDTEVILAGYMHFGENILAMLDGMFAIAIYDRGKESLLLARDKFGEKPLYYSICDNVIYFASELKTLKFYQIPMEMSEFGMNQFFSLSYIPTPYTIYEGVYKLEQGSSIYCKLGSSPITKKYYDLNSKISSLSLISDYNECKRLLQETVYDAVESRMIADVDIGAFLSGGIDSSVIVGIMSRLSEKKVNTFSIGYKLKSFDESKRAMKVAEYNNTNHTQFILDYDDVLGELDDIIIGTDEPFGDSSIIPSYIVSKLASEHVKVVLTGDAGDELFAGYSKYQIADYKRIYNKIPKTLRSSLIKPLVHSIPVTDSTRNIMRKARKLVDAPDSEFQAYYHMMSMAFKRNDRLKLFRESIYSDESERFIERMYNDTEVKGLSKILFSDLRIVLEGDMLCKVDRASMMNSLETRVPLLDPRVVELSYRIPSKYKLHGNRLKHIFKDTFSDLLPQGIISAPKRGFGVPVGEWLKYELKNDLVQLSKRDFIEEQKLFNYNYITDLIHQHTNKSFDRSFELWNYYVFQKWYRANHNI